MVVTASLNQTKPKVILAASVAFMNFLKMLLGTLDFIVIT